ncbi:diguanylate cyclase [Bacillus sp. BRMEA1]|uniref:diguanylate cyclase domain-containing protein n=1 Tax=Neobacillus endophyticus TaxID=2738405 RepID=UPI0015670C14|nr:diguanylate cyclase [Neobacillus endophyticus]NRD79153.1 diguanylate cyclase [Neobacillus endophyticus]
MGNLAGDVVFKNIAKIFHQSIHEEKVLVRLGGDELLIFNPYTTAEQSLIIAEAVR